MDLIGNRQVAEVPSDGPRTAYQLQDHTTTQGRMFVILVTRINGAVFALNPDLVERADCTPDTVITLVDGTKYVISESVPEFIDSVRHYRASLIAQASRLESEPALAVSDNVEQDAVVLPLHRKDR